jgi:hypothetical protein
MKFVRVVLFVFIAGGLSTNVLGYKHPGGMHPEAQIKFVRKMIENRTQPYYDAYQQLISKADSSCSRDHHAMPDFNVPGYYRDAAGHRKNSAGLQTDAFGAYACALAWQLTGETRYAEKALYFLMAWAGINTGYSDADGPLVMSYSGTGLIMAGELMYQYQGWQSDDRQKFFNWVEKVYLKASNEIRNRKNNWGDWGRFGSSLCAYLLDNQDEMAENSRLVKSDLFHKIAPDGHMPEETRRESNGIWYTYFSLAPITASFNVIYHATGENLFLLKEEDKSVKKALDYLFYFNQHPAEWTWFENPRQGSPESWPGNLFEAMGSIYGDEAYHDYNVHSRPLVYDKHHFAWSFPTLMPPFLNLTDLENN